MKLQKFKDWNDKLKLIVSIGTAAVIIFGAALTVIKKNKPRVEFIMYGSELVDSLDKENKHLIDSLELQIKEVRDVINVLTGVVAADLPYVDSCTYYLHWRGKKIIGRIKYTLSGNVYAFVPDIIVGERPFKCGYNYDWGMYEINDFEGEYILIHKEE